MITRTFPKQGVNQAAVEVSKTRIFMQEINSPACLLRGPENFCLLRFYFSVLPVSILEIKFWHSKNIMVQILHHLHEVTLSSAYASISDSLLTAL